MNIGIISALYLFLVISIMVVIIGENRNPLKAIPWLLVVLFVPVIGVILYIFFGEDLRHVYLINRKVYKRLSIIPTELAKRNEGLFEVDADNTVRLLEKNSASPLLGYDSVQIFTIGKSKFDRLKQDIANAKDHIHLQYYAFNDDELGQELAALLIHKAKEGVAVRILYDDVGSWGTKRAFWLRMRKEGVEVYAFMKVAFPILSSRANYRNHRKLVVIDSRVGYLGGMNIADRYAKGDSLGPWRDTHFRFTGDVLAEMESCFLLDWYLVTRRVVSNIGTKYIAELNAPAKVPPTKGEALCMQLVKGAPNGMWRTIEQTMVALILRAKKKVCIETPYFLPTEPLNSAIMIASLSGVEVELLIPKKGDSFFVQKASLSYVDPLLEAGVKVYRYEKGFLHSKFLTVDGEISMVGSTNMDFRSLEHNFEIAAVIYDVAVANELNTVFKEDLRHSSAILLEQWRRRSRTKRFGESVMRLFSPLL